MKNRGKVDGDAAGAVTTPHGLPLLRETPNYVPGQIKAWRGQKRVRVRLNASVVEEKQYHGRAPDHRD